MRTELRQLLVIGGIIGAFTGLPVGIGVLAMPGLGFLVAAGTLATALAGALVGACAGAWAGASPAPTNIPTIL